MKKNIIIFSIGLSFSSLAAASDVVPESGMSSSSALEANTPQPSGALETRAPQTRYALPKLPIEIKTVFSTGAEKNTVGVEIKNNSGFQLILARPGVAEVKWDAWAWTDEGGSFTISPIMRTSRSLPATHRDYGAIRDQISIILQDPDKFIVLQPGESFLIPLVPPIDKIDFEKHPKVLYQAHLTKLILGGGNYSPEELARFFDYRLSSKRFMMRESRWAPLSK